MESSTAHAIVQALTKAIVDHRLQPGTKLAEQRLTDHFGVSRTLVRQALFQRSQNRLIRMQPARGAFLSSPSVSESKQVFVVRRMLETEMTRAFAREATPSKLNALKNHVSQEKNALKQGDVSGRTELLSDFHIKMAELMNAHLLNVEKKSHLRLQVAYQRYFSRLVTSQILTFQATGLRCLRSLA